MTQHNHAPAPVLLEQLLAEGYSHGAPAHVRPETLRIDADAGADLICPDCGVCGQMRHHALHRGRRYRSVVVCVCGFAEEF